MFTLGGLQRNLNPCSTSAAHDWGAAFTPDGPDLAREAGKRWAQLAGPARPAPTP
jgi:hypothetical protein